MTWKNHSKILNKTKATEETYNNKIVVSCTGLCFWKKKKPYKYQNFYKCPCPEKKAQFCQENMLITANIQQNPTTQEMTLHMDITR